MEPSLHLLFSKCVSTERCFIKISFPVFPLPCRCEILVMLRVAGVVQCFATGVLYINPTQKWLWFAISDPSQDSQLTSNTSERVHTQQTAKAHHTVVNFEKPQPSSSTVFSKTTSVWRQSLQPIDFDHQMIYLYSNIFCGVEPGPS